MAGLDEVADALRENGAAVVDVACNVTNESQVEAMVDMAVETFGRLDIGINNAGISTPMKSLSETKESDLNLNFTINIKGLFFAMKYQIQQRLKQGGGIILNVASMTGLEAAPKLTAYCATKRTTVGITKTAVVEFVRKNIRVNPVCPFYSPTPLVTGSDIADKQQFLTYGSPMKRLCTLGELVTAMLVIIAPENSYMNESGDCRGWRMSAI